MLQDVARHFEGLEDRKSIVDIKGAIITIDAMGTRKAVAKLIGVVICVCLRNGKVTKATRYYISSLPVGVKRFARVVRNHWGIEITCYWTLDATYREDESRIRDVNMRENFAWLNRFTLSLLKQHCSKEASPRSDDVTPGTILF